MGLRGGGCSCSAASEQRPLLHPGGLRGARRAPRECPEPSSARGPPQCLRLPERPGARCPGGPRRGPPSPPLRPRYPAEPAQPASRRRVAAPRESPSCTRARKLGLRERGWVGSRKGPGTLWAPLSPVGTEKETRGTAGRGCAGGGGDARSPRAPAGAFREPGISDSHPLCLLPRPLPAGKDPGKGGDTGKAPGTSRGHPLRSAPRPSFLPGPKLKSPASGLSLLRSPRGGGGQRWPALRPDVGGGEVHSGARPRACVPRVLPGRPPGSPRSAGSVGPGGGGGRGAGCGRAGGRRAGRSRAVAAAAAARRVRVQAAAEAASAGIYSAPAPPPAVPGTAQPAFL